jgi:hypothetical protein
MLSNVERLHDTTARVCGSLARDGLVVGSSLVESIDGLDDAALAELITDASRGRSEFDTVLTAAAGVAAKRSERALGQAGLAQRSGHQNAVRFVQSLTGSSRGEASRQVRLGGAMGETDAAERRLREDVVSAADAPGSALLPWNHSITAAVSTGILSPTAGDAIARGLGEPGDTCDSETLRAAASRLVHDAASVSVDDLFGRARQERDSVDPHGVRERWQRRYENRSLTTRRNRDGQLAAQLVFDDESGVFITQLLDLALSPRRGGPRFVADADREWAARLTDDPRSNEQLSFDTVMDVLRCGTEVEESTTLRTHRPAVRVIVTHDHDSSDGFSGSPGHLEGNVDAVPTAVVEAHLCDAGSLPIHTDRAGNILDLGRESRLFSSRQRSVLRVRDGGCVWLECDRAAWTTEAHHINSWHAEKGRTDVADGVLLCRFHHLLLHNNGWKISRDGTRYTLTPPASVDPSRSPIELRSKSPGWDHHRRAVQVARAPMRELTRAADIASDGFGTRRNRPNVEQARARARGAG